MAALTTFINSLASISEEPVNVRMTITNTSDVVFAGNDLFSMDAAIYLQKSSSYMRFGEIEQLATDSLVLIVSDSLEQIIILPAKNKGMESEWLGLSGIRNDNASTERLNKQYTARFLQGGIQLQSRRVLTGTSFARESIQLTIDKNTSQPSQIKMIRRTLIPVDSTQAESIMLQLPEGSSRLLPQSGGFYFVKEAQTFFVYSRIDHTEQVLPVAISDRVRKNETGDWEPVRKYENYRLVNHTNE